MWRRWPWNVLVAAPVLLFAAAFVLSAIYPDCGHAEAPPCEASWIYDWQGYCFVLGVLATLLLALAVAVRCVWVRLRRSGRS